MKKRPNDPPPQQTPMASTKGDLRTLKRNSGETVKELKAFLHELKGRSPQEMLGIVASSQLVRATATSCILVFIGIAAFTAIPYAMADRNPPETPAEEPVATNEPTEAPAKPATPAEPVETTVEPDLSKLGVDEAKEAPPDKNPLENTTENFLDGLD